MVQRIGIGVASLILACPRPPDGRITGTALFVPEVDRLFVAARAAPLGGDAAIPIQRPRP
jgi:hypothetical protein